MPLSGSLRLSDVPYPELLSSETSVLAVSCDRNDHALCDAFLRDHFNICHASSVREAGGALDSCIFSVVLTAADLPDGTWTNVIHIARCLNSGPLMIVIEGSSDALSWTDKLANGAFDVVRRPLAEAEIRGAVSKAASRWRRCIETNAARVANPATRERDATAGAAFAVPVNLIRKRHLKVGNPRAARAS